MRLWRPDEQEVAGPLGPAPSRRPGSVRRTTSIDTTWPDGLGGVARLHGVARDVRTGPEGGRPDVLATATMDVGVSPDGRIHDIAVAPARDGAERIVGAPSRGWRLRATVDDALPGERDTGTALHLLLDDITGCMVIAPFAWSRHPEHWGAFRAPRKRDDRVDVCLGWAAGSTAHVEAELATKQDRSRRVGSLVAPDDPDGWHPLPDVAGMSMRRARRIDVWRDGDAIVVDSAFQDSATEPGGGRSACHEYGLRARIDAATLTLVDVAADPRVLPFHECPFAAAGISVMVGTPVAELRTVVLERLARARGCTHLNDALRTLADAPALVAHLGAPSVSWGTTDEGASRTCTT